MPSPSSSSHHVLVAVAGGMLASSCCILQVALSYLMGASCLGFSRLRPWRPVFVALTLLWLRRGRLGWITVLATCILMVSPELVALHAASSSSVASSTTTE